jgi:integrase/recombinase XerD
MNKVNATVSLFLDTRRINKGGLFPTAIRVSYRGRQWAVSLRVNCSKEDYKKITTEKARLNQQQKELKEILSAKKQKAIDVLNNLKTVTKDTFNKAFLSEIDIVNINNQADLKSRFEAYINDLKEDDRIRSADKYAYALKSFLSFRSNCELSQVDEEYLRKYEVYMQKKGCSRATTKMYLECMRTIFNLCIKKGIVNPKYYPFKEYTIGHSVKAKKALMPDQVKKLWEFKPLNDTQRQALDFWFLSYLCNGANNYDLMRLKWKDISNGKIVFHRSKTSRTATNSVPIVVHMHDEVKNIIERHGNPKKGQNDYVFPLVEGCKSEEEIVRTICHWRRHVNKCLNRIGKRLGFDFLLSIALSRHSFATALKLKGTPTAVIGDMLGHTSSTTTEFYLSSITDDMSKSITSTLLDFNTLRAV